MRGLVFLAILSLLTVDVAILMSYKNIGLVYTDIFFIHWGILLSCFALSIKGVQIKGSWPK